MKNQKASQATLSKEPGTVLGAPEKIGHNGMVLVTRDHRELSFEDWPRPSELELAQLAATLARGETVDPKRLVKEAWSLYWESCQKIKEDYLEVEAMLRAMDASDEDCFDVVDEACQLPQPKSYPITFQEMELLLLPKRKGRTADRAALFREYLFAERVDRELSSLDEQDSCSYWDYASEDLKDWREAVQNEVALEYGNCRAKLYDAESYLSFGDSFLRWYRARSKQRNSEIKAANALRGWEKRRQAKTAKTGARSKKDEMKQILNGLLKDPA